jgi:uncharacterized protein
MQITPWHNYALIIYLAGRADEMNLGKTKLQKLIYFLKAVKNLPLEYSYRFYTYGPYCDELAGDLSYLSAIHALDTSFDSNRFGYAVREGKNAVLFRNKAEWFFEKHQQDIDDVINKFMDKNAREMELLSTILYLTYNEQQCRENRDFLLERVKDLKPQFSPTEIEKGINELASFDYLEHTPYLQ